MKPDSRKRLIIDLDLPFQRRLKVIAALKGVIMRRYCLAATEKESSRDESQTTTASPFGQQALDRLAALRAEAFQYRTLPGDSTELIRAARSTKVPTQ
jgi:hypothetical protein